MAGILIVGAGLSGAVVARQLAEAGHKVLLRDSRPHIAGNCHTERDPETGVMVHVYGPHIFHTSDEEVWAYVNRFERFRPYEHRVRATAGGKVFTLPVTLQTINEVYGTALRPEEAEAFMAARVVQSDEPPVSFEDQALRFVGREIYELLFRGYTLKQWGTDPRDLPASVLKRLPMRYTYDDRYFNHRYQAMPETGYTAMVAQILAHEGITVELGRTVGPQDLAGWDHVFWTGSLDGFFGCDAGRLAYRTLDFERFTHQGDWQGIAVMNHPDAALAHTRITEHKHFMPWEQHEGSVLYRETPRECGPEDTPYYPVRLVEDQSLLAAYVARARALEGVTFLGRLGTYRYLDMDVTIREALDCASEWQTARAKGAAPRVFSVDPL